MIIVAAVVLFLALGGIIAIGLAGFSMNRDAAATQAQLVDNALGQIVVDTLNGIQTVAFWDTTVQKLQGGRIDKKWVDYEIGDYLTKVYGQDKIWILDPQDRPIYSFSPGQRNNADIIGIYASDLNELVRIVRSGKEDGRRMHDASFRSNQTRYSGISKTGPQGRWTSHIVENQGHAIVLSVMTIVPVTNQKLLHSRPFLLVSAVRIGIRQLRNISSSLLIRDLRVTPVTTPATSSGQYVISTDKGVSIQRYQWTARAPGKFLLTYVLPLFVIITIISAFLLLFTINRVQRITRSLVDKEREASFLANYDPLSSLPNRRLFTKQLEAALAPDRIGKQRTILAFCDLDNFKTINDTLGHEVGDVLIIEVARRLRESFPECVQVSRFGGDEFALMHSEKWLSEQEFAARIQQAFDEPISLGGTPTRIGISVGISIAPDHGSDGTDLMSNADIALYDAKDGGRARCTVYHRGMRDEIVVRKEREGRIQQMLETERFELHYQPIVDIRAACVSGMEALLRWPSDDPNPMSPDAFIPIAESAGIMPELGNWVIYRAFHDSLRWPELSISVNLSPVQIKTPGLIDNLVNYLRISGADAARITFEITEGVLLESSEYVREVVHKIRKMGFKLALDDFGTGYSSLSYLQEYKFDKLKIDRSFICDGKLEDQRSALLVKAVIDIGRALGIEVVAEGVENFGEALILKTLGCDHIQGWLYGRALPPVKATENLRHIAATLSAKPMTGVIPSLKLAT